MKPLGRCAALIAVVTCLPLPARAGDSKGTIERVEPFDASGRAAIASNHPAGRPRPVRIPQFAEAQVTIAWSELRELLTELDSLSAQRASEPEPPPPAGWLLNAVSYRADVSETTIHFAADLDLHVLSDTWQFVPVIGAGPSITSAAVNGKPADVSFNNGWYCLLLKEKGRMKASVAFSLPRAKASERNQLNLKVPQCPINVLELTIPETGIAIDVSPSSGMRREEKKKATLVRCTFPRTSDLQVTWTAALAPEELAQTEPAEVAPVSRCSTSQLLSIGEGLMRLRASLAYTVLQGKLDHLAFRLPKDTNLIDVSGARVRGHRVQEDESGKTVRVLLDMPATGTVDLVVQAEKSLGDTSAVASIPQISALEVDRDTGYIGINATTNIEIRPETNNGLTTVDPTELPSFVWTSLTHPVLLSYKYLKHPYELVLDIKRHQDVPVLATTIDTAQITSLLTEEGKFLHCAIFQTRNNQKQFLKLELPRQTQVLGAFVSGRPVKPSRDPKGDVLVPLIASSSGGKSPDSFPVEILYLDDGARMGFLGKKEVAAASVDIPISSLTWALYLPEPFHYGAFRGNIRESKDWRALVRQERLRRKPLAQNRQSDRRPGTQAGSQMYSNPQFSPRDNYESFQQGIVQELQQALTKGVFPVRITVPEQGKLYRFQKQLVMEKDEAPAVRFRYYSEAISSGVRSALSALALGAIALGLVALVQVQQSKPSVKLFRWMKIAVALLGVLVVSTSIPFGRSPGNIALLVVSALLFALGQWACTKQARGHAMEKP